MNHLIQNLVESLREELKEYGEMLAMLDQQQSLVAQRQTHELLQSVADVNTQAEAIAAVRREREQRRRNVALALGLSETSGFGEIISELPSAYRPLVQALVQENNELLVRVHQRARQNHLLLSHAVELMQQLINAIVPGATPGTYDETGQLPVKTLPQPSFYEAIG